MSVDLSKFFYPKSICIPGASTKEKSIGYELLNTIKQFGFTGNVYPVNPKADDILGYKCFHSIEEIPDEIELAVIAVPKRFVFDTVDSLLGKGVKSIILITAGFKEIGKEGEELEKKLLEKIKNSGARLVGPNCMGIINSNGKIKLNATFVAEQPEKGNTAFLSQSGALGAAVLNSLRATNIKFAHFISVGNKADLNEIDFLHYWQNDENIKSVTMYLESFENGEELIKSIINGEIKKPLIILKAGKTDAGMKAAQSHTGALGSHDKTVDEILKQFGIIRVQDINELFNTAKGFENFEIPAGKRIAVITNAGGPAILAVDALEKSGLFLAEFSEETQNKLREIVHPEGSVNNPVDLLPGGSAEIYKSVNEICSADNNVDAVISIFVEPVMVQPMPVINSVYSANVSKPVFQTAMPLPEFWKSYEENKISNKPVFRNPEDAPKVIANMIFHDSVKLKLIKNQDSYLNLQNAKPIENRFNKNGFLNSKECGELLNKYKIPLAAEYFFKPHEPLLINEEKYPLVLKGLNSNIIHKAEFNAVKLNIKDHNELIEAADQIKSGFAETNFTVEEFHIQQFIKPRLELLIGGFRDPSFGPVVMFGSGGKYVEVLNDTSLRSAYICKEDIWEMIDETKAGTLLKGVRGEQPADINKLSEIIYSCAKMMIENPFIKEFDLNPLILDERGDYCCVDYRIKI